MSRRYQSQNPFTTLAISSMRSLKIDPGNEFSYTQRAVAYAAIAQAIELEELGTMLSSMSVLIAQASDELERISSSIDDLPRRSSQ